MAGTNRREFLRLAAGSAGAAAVLAALPPAIREALAVAPARVSGTIHDVEHVVVLMQENRSFDHYFGALRGVRGFDDPRPIPLPGGVDVWQQPRSGSGRLAPFRLDTTLSGAQCMADIDHSWKGSHARWKNHDNWVREKGPMCMGYFTRADLPFYYALADAFTVCDAWFCSVHGPTNPNRMHLFTGTSGLAVGRPGNHAVNNVDDGNWTADMARDNPGFNAYDWMTYAERLQNAGVSWKVYQEYDNYGDNSLAYFRNFRGLDTNSPLYRRGRDWAPGSNASNAYQTLGLPLIEQFRNDVQNGNLPQVSWIVAPFSMCEHPEAAPAYGEALTARLLAALAANPAVWSRTVFIITYDENGGFFDHIPAHVPALTASLGKSTVATTTESHNGVPLGLGVRVPTLVVSPWSRGGWVNSQVFDHTSVIRFLEARFPQLSFSHIQRIVRKGELRVNGRRADSKDRLEEGQSVRIPPLRLDAPKVAGKLSEAEQKTLAALKEMTLFEDDDVLVLNKPAGLAVQGGSGTTRHIDQMLEVMRDAKGQKPRLVHRIDKETSGCLLVAKTRFAATHLTGAFRHRSARKIYWALVAGVPKPKQGRISTYLAKEESEDDSIMRIAEHGDEGASHAVTYYAVVETAAQKLAWVSLKPVTGRTHQLRAHMAHIDHAIVGDPKYFNKQQWDLPGGLQNRLHLLARRIVIPHPRGGVIDASAPLPPHMQQSWNLLGFDAKRFDPIENAPEE